MNKFSVHSRACRVLIVQLSQLLIQLTDSPRISPGIPRNARRAVYTT